MGTVTDWRLFLRDIRDDLLVALFCWGPPLEDRRSFWRAAFRVVALRGTFTCALFWVSVQFPLGEGPPSASEMEDFFSYFALIYCGIYLVPYVVTIHRRLRGKGVDDVWLGFALGLAGFLYILYGFGKGNAWNLLFEAMLALSLSSDAKWRIPHRFWQVLMAVLVFLLFIVPE